MLELKEKMSRTYLIQRLEPPRTRFIKIGDVEIKDNPFSFGGGLHNGGFGKEAMDLLRPIFSFDYMGAAEFEFGAVPAAFEFMVRQKFVFGSVLIKKKNLIYYICPESYKDEVIQRIPDIYSGKIQTKEWVGMDSYFESIKKKETPRLVGWLEIDNGFLMFGDQETWERTKKLFEIQ